MHLQPHHLALTGRALRRPLAGVRAQDGKGSAQAAKGRVTSGGGDAELAAGGRFPGKVTAHLQEVAVPFLKGAVLLPVVTLPIAVVTLPIAVVTLPIAVVTLPIAVVMRPIAVVMRPIGVVMLPIGVVTLPIAVVTRPIGVVMRPIGVVMRPFYKEEAVLAGFRGQTGGFSSSSATGSRRRQAVVIAAAPPPSATGLRPQLRLPGGRRLSCSLRGFATPCLLVSRSFRPPP